MVQPRTPSEPTRPGKMSMAMDLAPRKPTGPKVLHLLLVGRALDRLYVSFANRLLGGQPFSSIVEGPLLTPAVDLNTNTIYFDEFGLEGLGQMFVSYDTLLP